jgi:uncharacterized membrane protein
MINRRVAYGLTQILSAAYIHVGAVLGTIAAQTFGIESSPKRFAALKEGKPDERLAARQTTIKQNTFLAVPVVLIMISNHYLASLWTTEQLIIISILILVGWIAAKFIRRA